MGWAGPDAVRLVGRIADERRPPLDGAITVVMGALRSADRRASITRMNRSACGFVASQSKRATGRYLKALVPAFVSTMCAVSIEAR
jgi:hypothetical protein